VSTRLDAGVELLDRSLAYTRVALAHVEPTSLTRRTPCSRWDLGALLAHMDDALDAFLEAAGGTVATERTPHPVPLVADLRDKACTLLGTWSRAEGVPVSIAVGGVAVDPVLVVDAAALEITVHGWDVATALGLDHPLPHDLARELLPIAEDVAPLGQFAPALPPRGDAGSRLLGAVGRRP
jgi:uncharacterized protein (TIGR03086 family)